MSRRPVQISDHLPFHFVARVHNRCRFPLELQQSWEIFQERLYFLHHAFNFRIHSFVMMPNHIHGIFEAPEGNQSIGMGNLMRESAKEMNRKSGMENQLWGRRYFSCLLGSHHYFMNCYKYVYQNPLHPGLCERVEDYRFSTLNQKLGLQHTMIPFEEDTLLFEGAEQVLAWLNRRQSTADHQQVTKSLLRREFKLPMARRGRFERMHELESRLI